MKGFIIISDGFHCGLRCQDNQFLSGRVVNFCVCFGGCLAGCCACASPGDTLYILSKLATMSVLCSWYVHCLGQVIWWSDRNRQGLLTEYIFMSLNECIFM